MNIKDLDRRYIIKAIKSTIEENYLANTLNDFATGFATWYETVTPELCEELKEENEKFKDENESLARGLAYQTMKLCQLEAGLAENDELKEELLYYRMYVYSVDPGGDCSPEKEHVDGFTDDPEQRKILYERIGYESDEESDEEHDDNLDMINYYRQGGNEPSLIEVYD